MTQSNIMKPDTNTKSKDPDNAASGGGSTPATCSGFWGKLSAGRKNRTRYRVEMLRKTQPYYGKIPSEC